MLIKFKDYNGGGRIEDSFISTWLQTMYIFHTLLWSYLIKISMYWTSSRLHSSNCRTFNFRFMKYVLNNTPLLKKRKNAKCGSCVFNTRSVGFCAIINCFSSKSAFYASDIPLSNIFML